MEKNGLTSCYLLLSMTRYINYLTEVWRDWGCSLMLQCLPSICKTLGSIYKQHKKRDKLKRKPQVSSDRCEKCSCFLEKKQLLIPLLNNLVTEN